MFKHTNSGRPSTGGDAGKRLLASQMRVLVTDIWRVKALTNKGAPGDTPATNQEQASKGTAIMQLARVAWTRPFMLGHVQRVTSKAPWSLLPYGFTLRISQADRMENQPFDGQSFTLSRLHFLRKYVSRIINNRCRRSLFYGSSSSFACISWTHFRVPVCRAPHRYTVAIKSYTNNARSSFSSCCQHANQAFTFLRGRCVPGPRSLKHVSRFLVGGKGRIQLTLRTLNMTDVDQEGSTVYSLKSSNGFLAWAPAATCVMDLKEACKPRLLRARYM